MNAKEIDEKYENQSKQILEVKKEIRNNNKTNGLPGSSSRCTRHASVIWRVPR